MSIASSFLPLTRLLGALDPKRAESWAPKLAQRSLRRNGGRVQRARQQLAACLPELDELQQARLLYEHFVYRHRMMLNLARLRYGNLEGITQSICSWEGVELLQALSARGRGVIVATPHFGDWERFNLAMGTQVSAAVLYKPSRDLAADKWLLQMRSRTGVVPVPVTGQGIREIYRRLNQGGIVGILPDQMPKRGAGVVAPFFAQATATMSLIHRLVQSTGCAVVLGRCYYQAAGDSVCDSGTGCYVLKIDPAPEGIDDHDPVVSTTALNAGVERVVRESLAQYLWTYKRWP